MKLIVATVQDQDAERVVNGLTEKSYRITRIGSTGGFLQQGNTTLLIGIEDEKVPGVMALLKRTCHRRTQIAVPYSPALEPGLLYMPENFEVEVGGAIVFVANVSRFERITHDQVAS